MSSLLSFLFFQNAKVEALRIPLNQDTAPDEGCFDQVYKCNPPIAN